MSRVGRCFTSIRSAIVVAIVHFEQSLLAVEAKPAYRWQVSHHHHLPQARRNGPGSALQHAQLRRKPAYFAWTCTVIRHVSSKQTSRLAECTVKVQSRRIEEED